MPINNKKTVKTLPTNNCQEQTREHFLPRPHPAFDSLHYSYNLTLKISWTQLKNLFSVQLICLRCNLRTPRATIVTYKFWISTILIKMIHLGLWSTLDSRAIVVTGLLLGGYYVIPSLSILVVFLSFMENEHDLGSWGQIWCAPTPVTII